MGKVPVQHRSSQASQTICYLVETRRLIAALAALVTAVAGLIALLR